MRFSMSGRTQYLIVDFKRRRAMDERDVRAGAEHLERRLGGGVAAADDDDALAVVRVGLAVVVVDVRQILAGDAEQHRDDRSSRSP